MSVWHRHQEAKKNKIKKNNEEQSTKTFSFFYFNVAY